MPFLEWQAATRTGLDLWKWETGGYPPWFMAKVVAFYEGDSYIQQHTQDAAITLNKRQAKRKK